MTSTAHFRQCDYLHPHTLPHAFTSEQAELVHISEQISSLDSHISQLNTLRRALHRRSRQLHNLLLPIYTLPIEVLSYIFQHLVKPGHCDYPDFDRYRKCLGQALVVSSVSSHFRHVAFSTPELWKRIPLRVSTRKAIGPASTLLQHCIVLAPSVSISVFDTLYQGDARSAINTLLTSDATRKIKDFDLYYSSSAPDLWLEKASSFPILDTLSIRDDHTNGLSFDLGTLTAVTRLSVYALWLDLSTIVPSSVQYLYISCARQPVLVSLLYQCPNLIECTIDEPTGIVDDSDGEDQLTKPLILTRLKKLTLDVTNAIAMSSSVENLRLPSLEFLAITYFQANEFTGVALLCRNVSATLTILIINATTAAFDHDSLYQLCKLPFPKLRKLELSSASFETFQSTIHALALLESEYISSETHHLLALRSVILSCDQDIEPRFLLDVLKEWRIGERFRFSIQFRSYRPLHEQWSPELREELRSIVGSCRIEVMWSSRKVNCI